MRVFTFSDLVSLAESIDVHDDAAKQNWRDLFHVYNSAMNNPPEGIIGVGAITYAEKELLAFQENQNNENHIKGDS